MTRSELIRSSFGFTGALTELGLPQGEIPLALFAFNVGVGTGRLAFIAVALTVTAIAHRIDGLVRMRGYVMTGTAYAIGGLASFGFIERVAQIV
jgi:hypothetical protein